MIVCFAIVDVEHKSQSAYGFSLRRFSQAIEATTNSERYIETSNLLRPGYNVTAKGFVMQLIRLNASRQPNTISMWVVGSMIVCYCIVSFGLASTIIYSWDAIASGETWALVLTIVLSAILVLFCIFISIQPRQKFRSPRRPFKVFRGVLLTTFLILNSRLLGSLGTVTARNKRFYQHLPDVDARLLHLDTLRCLDDSR